MIAAYITLMAIAAVTSQDTRSGPSSTSHIDDLSVFLSRSEFDAFKASRGGLRCLFGLFGLKHHSHGIQNITFPYDAVLGTLAAKIEKRAPIKQKAISDVIGNTRLLLQKLLSAAELARTATDIDQLDYFIISQITTPENLLCLEMLVDMGRVNVFIPFLTESALALQKHHNIEFLEQHFGFPMVFPAADIINLFSDKALFGEWMVRQGLGGNIPSVYTSVAEVKYPVMVKFTHGRLGEGISIANDQTELETATKSINSTDYILQVSQHAVACGSTVYTLGA